MSQQAKPRIEERTLRAGEITAELFVVAAEYPTAVAAQAAWKRVERIKGQSDDVSIVRLKKPVGDGSIIVAVAEEEAQVKPARRLLSQGGQAHVPDERTLMTVYMRRGQVSASASDRPGGLRQQTHFGESGAQIGLDGDVRPQRRQG